MNPTSEDSELAVRIPAGAVELHGDLGVPGGATGVILFAHGSGSSRHSPRNRRVAAELRGAGFATLAKFNPASDRQRWNLKDL